MSEAPPKRFWGEARPGVLLRPCRDRARAPGGEQSLGAGSGNVATPGAPTWCAWAGAQALLGARKGPTLRPALWRPGLGAGLPAAGPGGAAGASSRRVLPRRASWCIQWLPRTEGNPTCVAGGVLWCGDARRASSRPVTKGSHAKDSLGGRRPAELPQPGRKWGGSVGPGDSLRRGRKPKANNTLWPYVGRGLRRKSDLLRFLKGLRLARLVLRETTMAKLLGSGTETSGISSPEKEKRFAEHFLCAGIVLSV